MLYNIVCIDDNLPKLGLLETELEKYGGCLTNVHTAQEAISVLKCKDYHLVGIAADYVKKCLLPSVKMIRDAATIPILIMSSHYDSTDMMASLRCGADGYTEFPGTMEEIVVLVTAYIRRHCDFDYSRHDRQELAYQGIHLNLRERKVTVGGEGVDLTRGEFQCLKMLMSYPGMVFTYDLLYYGSFGEEARAEYITNSIRALIGRLRHKVGPDYAEYIRSAHGVGYKLEKNGNQ